MKRKQDHQLNRDGTWLRGRRGLLAIAVKHLCTLTAVYPACLASLSCFPANLGTHKIERGDGNEVCGVSV